MNILSWLFLLGSLPVAWLLAHIFVMNFAPQIYIQFENWLHSQLHDRRRSTQFFICYVVLGLSSLLIWTSLNALPIAGEFIFFHAYLASSFVLLTMLFTALSACLMIYFGVVEFVLSLQLVGKSE